MGGPPVGRRRRLRAGPRLRVGLALTALAAAALPAAAQEEPREVLAELRAAAEGAREISDGRLRRVTSLLIDWEYEPPAGTEDVAWSEPLAHAGALLAGRAGLEDQACVVDGLHAGRLDLEGRRADALLALEAACRRHGDEQFYRVQLLAQWGQLLRDENRFAEARDRLRAAERLVADWNARPADLTPDRRFHLALFEAIVQNELGCAAHELGMSDVAAEHLDRGAGLARDVANEGASAALWGANLVYRLNAAVEVRDFRAAADMQAEFESDPWRAHLPPETDAQVRSRLAMVATERAWTGELPPGSGEAELLALLPELAAWPGEAARARAWVARSMLDRGAADRALAVARAGRAELAEEGAHAPLKLQLLAMEGRALADAGDPEAARRLLADELAPAMERFLERWSDAPIEEAGTATLAWGRSREAVSELLRLELRELARPEESRVPAAERAFRWVLELQGVATFAREHGVPVPDLAAIRRELLPAGTALLCWFPGRVRSHLFVVDGRDVEHVELAALRTLEAAARDVFPALHAALRAPDGAAERARLDAALEAARAALVPDEVVGRLRGLDAVQLVGLGSFGYVPFELLPDGPGGDPLGLRLAVAYQPSVVVGTWLARRGRERPPAPARVRVHVGAGETAAGAWSRLDPLAASDAELLRLGEEYVAAGVSFDATRSPAPLDLGALESRLCQVVAHGDYDSQRRRPAGLVLDPTSPDGALYATDIEELGGGLPQVVVVTACGAGRARPRRGDDGRGHLRGALFAAGADCAVLSEVDVELSAALASSARLHRELARGASVAQALRAARRGARSRGDRAEELHALLAHAWGAAGVAPFPAPAAGSSPTVPGREVPADDPPAAARRAAVLAGLGLAAVLIAVVVRRRVRARG